MRVADLAASEDFYESIAPEAGYRVNKVMPSRSPSWATGPGGGDLSIVEGEPTQAAHLAFVAGRKDALTDPDGNTVELVGGGYVAAP